MDFSQFSNPEFDAKEWINQAFKQPEAQQNREQYANSLVMKLQLFIGEVNKSLEETSGQIVQSMPRVLREVESMQSESVLLQNRMRSVQQDVRQIETDTANAMESLLKIDAVKTKIHTIENSLREVQNWSVLTSDMDEVFSSGDIELMSARLIALQNSLNVIGSKVPDHKEKSTYLEGVKDQFIAVISPSVVTALSSKSADNAQYFVRIFDQLERMADIRQTYQKCLKTELNKSWVGFLSTKQDNSDVIELWGSFYDLLLHLWFDEMKWVESSSLAASNDPGALIQSALGKSISQLQPSLEDTMKDMLDSYSEKLPVLIQLKQKTEAFLSSLNQGQTVAPNDQLSTAVYNPLLSFVINYQSYQQSILLEKLNIWSFDSPEFGGNVGRFADSVNPVFGESLAAIDQCILLTGPIGLPFLVKALQTYLNNYMSMIKRLAESGSLKYQLQQSSENAGNDPDQPSQPQTVPEDWPRLNILFSLLKNTGEILLKMAHLDEALSVPYANLLEIAEHYGIASHSLRDETEGENEGEHGHQQHQNFVSPFEEILIKDKTVRSAVEQMVFRLGNDSNPSFLPDIQKQALRVNQRALKLVTEQIFKPMDGLLITLTKLPAWSSATVGEALSGNLPSFGLAPQEYITKVGAYLMTLAHQMEPYLTAEDPGFCQAIRSGNLQHIDRERKPDSSSSAVSLVIENAGMGIMARYAEAASRIPSLSQSGSQQLATDIEYLCNVVVDLGMNPSATLLALKELLRMDLKRLNSAASSSAGSSFPAALVAEVKAMRKEQ